MLNLRQRRLEDEGFSAPDVLYMGCFFYTKLTTDTRAGSLDRLRQVAGCDRCFLQQDLVVLPIHVGNCHWICVELQFRHNEAICFDSLGVSFIHIVCFQSSLAMQQESSLQFAHAHVSPAKLACDVMCRGAMTL